MGCVVLAAALLPPWVFGRLVREDSGRWAMPVTLGGLWRNGLAALCETTLGLVLSMYGWWCLVVLRATPKRRARFRKAVHRAARWAVCRRCGVEVALPDVAGEHREGGELLVVPVHTCSDALLLAATSSRCVQVGGNGPWLRGLRRKWLDKPKSAAVRNARCHVSSPSVCRIACGDRRARSVCGRPECRGRNAVAWWWA